MKIVSKWHVFLIMMVLLTGCSVNSDEQTTASSQEVEKENKEKTCPPSSEDSPTLTVKTENETNDLEAKTVYPVFGGHMKMLTDHYEYTSGERNGNVQKNGKTYSPKYITIDDKMKSDHPEIRITIEESVGEEHLDIYDGPGEIRLAIRINNLKAQDLSSYPELCNFDLFYKGEFEQENGTAHSYSLIKAINHKLYTASAVIP
ncbi:hypothetical protein [Rossellomorea aquimaris]|uniref:hypothetical protein n=1 Tax=Rossellomorea aquimaris TaxID=189382 RepID=UPI0007D07FBB|nr:hypothetical protein [Rossellomorea aquimaris]